MKSIRLLALSICLVISLTQDPLQRSNLFAQSELDPTLLGSGSFTLETAGLDRGSRISLETDLQDVVAIAVEDTNAGRELVSLETASVQEEFRSKGRREADVVIEADSIKGKFSNVIDYDLTETKTLKVTITLRNGLAFPLIIHSGDTFTNKRITQRFSGKACVPVTLNCPTLGCSTSTTCCYTGTLEYCASCITCTISCGPGPCPRGGGGVGGCDSALPGPQETVAFTIDGEPHAVPLPKSSFVLRRTEAGENNISYLMEEWAIIASSTRADEPRPGIEVLKASSPAFAAAKSGDLSRSARFMEKRNATDAEVPRETLLIVEAPVHPHNSRFAPTPRLGLIDANVPPGLSPGRQFLIRADFSEEDDSPRQLQVLHAEGRVPQEMLDILKERLELDRKSIKRHRTVVFALVRVGDAFELTNLATVMPKCCCGGVHCV